MPALIENGLYHEINKTFSEFNGYYSVVQVLTLLAFMALIRIKTPEQLRWQSPGEFGKLLGLDRCPEVKCLREKMSVLSQDGAAEKWGEQLSQKWMNDNPDFAGVLYVDGHVRLYDGKENVPKQFVSRQRLCLKGFMDFWVNDRLGQPFFVVRQAVNHGMLEALRNDIVPRLLKEVPGQPSKKEIEIDINLHRFIIVFDREGYSPEFLKTGKLIIRLHNLSTCGLDKKLDKLLQHLNDSKMKFPGTNMELVYERIGSEKVSSKLPAGQDF